VPFVSAVAVVYVGLALISQLLFNLGDAAGGVCRETTNAKPLTSVPWGDRTVITQRFKVSELCWASGVELVEGRRYKITIKQPKDKPWKDAGYESDLGGFEIGDLPRVRDRILMSLFVPLRRVVVEPWFRPIARIGAKGNDEYALDPAKPTSVRQPKDDELEKPIRARRTGELFLYVNDAVIGLPGIAGYFYRNNEGEAEVTIEHVPGR
jgi:hypothetical protein